MEALDWPWWPDEEHPHQLEELPEELPERYTLDSEWLQSELELECEVCQLLLQVHFERVWWLKPDWPEKQVAVPLPPQESPLEDLTPAVEEDQREPESELSVLLVPSPLPVAEFVLAQTS